MATYVLQQYNKPTVEGDNDLFIGTKKTGNAVRIETEKDNSNSLTYHNEALEVTGGLEAGHHYYFHVRIKKISSSSQTFNIYLYNNELPNQNPYKYQFIKTQTVGISTATKPCDWTNVEFIFTPLEKFTHILFELQRIAPWDTNAKQRESVIGYQELSEIKNFFNSRQGIPNFNSNSVQVIKIGVQSRPGYLMCINGEEIRTSKTGIYEIKNGIITIDSFSVIAGAKLTSAMSSWMYSTESDPTRSRAFLNDLGEREIDRFTIDYLYRTEE